MNMTDMTQKKAEIKFMKIIQVIQVWIPIRIPLFSFPSSPILLSLDTLPCSVPRGPLSKTYSRFWTCTGYCFLL